MREVREETGVEAEHVRELGEVRYWYRHGGARSQGGPLLPVALPRGDTADHDEEVEEVRWMALREACMRSPTRASARSSAVRCGRWILGWRRACGEPGPSLR